MSAEVSVLIPTHNRAEFLPETIDAILSQTYPPAEVIVVDDGSTDNTAEVMANPPAKVTYVRIENSRVCVARNVAVSLSKTPYLAFCDDDDLWRRDKLEQQMELHLRVPGLEYSFTNFSVVTDGLWAEATKFDQAPAGYFEGATEIFTGGMVSEEPFYKRLLVHQPIFPSTVLLTRALFDRVGGFYDELGKILAEDWEFALRCVLNTAKVGFIVQPVVGIRKHAKNISGNNLRTTLGELEIMKFILERHAIDKPTRGLVVQEMARRRIIASFDAFQNGDFALCKALLGAVPRGQLTAKLWVKLLTASSPAFVARKLHSMLVSGGA